MQIVKYGRPKWDGQCRYLTAWIRIHSELEVWFKSIEQCSKILYVGSNFCLVSHILYCNHRVTEVSLSHARTMAAGAGSYGPCLILGRPATSLPANMSAVRLLGYIAPEDVEEDSCT